MNTLMQADIFFFITSVAVVVLSIGVAVLLYYAIHIMRDIRAMVAKVRKAGDEIEQDFESLRMHLHEEGTKGKAIVSLVLGYISKKLTTLVGKRSKKKTPSSEI